MHRYGYGDEGAAIDMTGPEYCPVEGCALLARRVPMTGPASVSRKSHEDLLCPNEHRTQARPRHYG